MIIYDEAYLKKHIIPLIRANKKIIIERHSKDSSFVTIRKEGFTAFPGQNSRIGISKPINEYNGTK